MAVNVPKNYITGKELEELTGIPNLALKAKELMYRPKAEKRQKNIFGDFYRKTLKAKYFDIGQGGRFGTLHYLKPTPNQIKTIQEYHLRKGAKYGVTQETADRMKRFYNRPEFRKYIRKGEFIPDEVLKQYGVTQNQAANTTYRLAQALNGKKFANVKIDLPKNKSVAKKLIKKIEQAPFGNPYQLTAYKEAQNVITGELGESYFKNTNFETMKREARRILNREGVPVFDPKKKDSFGFNVNEIIGIKTASRQGLAPYSQFVNIMEGKLNTAQYANFVRQFEKFNNRMQTEADQTKVIKEYNEYRKNFIKKNKGIKDSDIPKISFKTPEEIYGKRRISSLTDQGLDLNKSYEDVGYSIDVGKKTRTLKEFIADPKKISKLKKFGKVGAITGTALSIPAIVSAKEPDDFTSEQVGYNLDSDVDYGDPDTWNLKVGDFLETGAVTAAVAPLATKKGRSIYGKAAGTIARGVGTPLGIGLLTAGLSPEGGYDLSKQEDRLGFEIEALFAKPLVRESQAFARKIPASRPLLRRATQTALNLGIPGRFATTAARVATPLGLLSLAGEAGLFTYREAMKTKEAIDAMSEEEKQNYLSQQELDALAAEATFASGGRVGFDEGGPGDPSRRKFLKILGGLASLPVVGKLFKFVGPAVKKSLENAPTGTPDWFAPLVEKIIKKGVDISDKAATIERQTVKELKTPDGTYTLTQTSDTGEIIVSVDTGVGVNDLPVNFIMTPNRIIDIASDGKPITEFGEFTISEIRPTGRMVGPEDYDIDLDEFMTNNLDDVASDWHAVEEFATGKTSKPAQASRRQFKQFVEEDPLEDVLNRQRDYDLPKPDDD